MSKVLEKPLSKQTLPDPLLDMSDEELVAKFRESGETAYFETIVRRYQRELFAYLVRYIGDPELAEDAFQATFITVHNRLETFEAGRRFRPWLYAVAVNKTIDLKRYNRRRQAISLDAPIRMKSGDNQWSAADQLQSRESEPVENAIENETASRVRSVIGMMNENTQQLLNMVYFQGMKYADVSEALGIPVGTVKSRVFNAMIKLNDAWRRKYPDQIPQ